MADVNQRIADSGEWVFTPDDIRSTAGYEPLTDADRYRDDPAKEEPENDPGKKEEEDA